MNACSAMLCALAAEVEGEVMPPVLVLSSGEVPNMPDAGRALAGDDIRCILDVDGLSDVDADVSSPEGLGDVMPETGADAKGLVDAALAPAPARTMHQSSSSHFHVAVRRILASGSEAVGAGRTMDVGEGRVKAPGGDAGKR